MGRRRAQTDVLTASFIVPYLVIVGSAMGYFAGHPLNMLVHIAFLGMTSRLLLQAVTVAIPILPFSQPSRKLASSGGVIGWFVLGIILAIVLGPLLAFLVYPSGVRTIVAAIILVGLSVLLDRLTRIRLGEQAQLLEFTERA